MNKLELVMRAMAWKKSAESTAARLNMSLSEYLKLKDEVLRLKREEDEIEEGLSELQNSGFAVGYTEDLDRGIAEYKIQSSFEPRTAEEIEELIKLDKTKWKLARYSVWNGGKEDVWLTSAKVVAVQNEESITDKFTKFLETYSPKAKVVANHKKSSRREGMLIINKQDTHVNKYSIDENNDINERFDNILEKTKVILDQATLHSHLSQITYILGSDLLDSEWTEQTTKGTPQRSILPYQEAFEAVCDHEVSMVTLLLQYCDHVIIPFIPGNHDQFVGWHLVNWLKTYFKDQLNLEINTEKSNTKYMRFGNSGFMFNHGDGMKPEKLAQVFPLEFKKEWSNCEYFNILTGDKHHEITKDIGGIRFYQVPAWSKAISNWDSKHGWTMVKGEIQAFFVSKDKGITNIYKEPL